MFREETITVPRLAQWDAYALEHFNGDPPIEDLCPGVSPGVGFYCTLFVQHDLTHLAGVDNEGTAVAEWDDDRSTDGEEE